MSAPTKYQALVAIAEELVAIDWEGDDVHEDVMDLQKRAKKALKMKGMGNPNLGEARAKGHAVNREKGVTTRERMIPIIERISAEAAAERRKLTFAEIAAALNGAGVPAPKGGQWYAASVRRVMEQPS